MVFSLLKKQRPHNRVSLASNIHASHESQFLLGSTPSFLWWLVEQSCCLVLIMGNGQAGEASAPTAGFVTVCEQSNSSKERLADFIRSIEGFGKVIPRVFRVLEEN